MIYFYEFGYFDYEGTPTRIITHTNKYTKSEFSLIVCDLYWKINKIHEAKHNEWLKSPDFTYLKDDYPYSPRVDNLYSDVLDELITNCGFQYLVMTTDFIADSCNDIIERDSENREVYDDLLTLRNYFEKIGKRDDKINTIIE